jgi:hypothetical protein
MAVTVRGTDILFNDGTTQNTAPSTPISTFTGTGTVGDIAIALCTTASSVTPGGTVSGANLFRISSLNMSNNTGGQLANSFQSATPGGDFRNKTAAFTLGRTNFSPMSGTWRVLSAVGTTMYSDSYGSVSSVPMTIAIRIA